MSSKAEGILPAGGLQTGAATSTLPGSPACLPPLPPPHHVSQFLETLSQDLDIGTHRDIFLEREWTPVASVSLIFASCSLKTMTRLSSVSLMPGTMSGTEGRSADVC